MFGSGVAHGQGQGQGDIPFYFVDGDPFEEVVAQHSLLKELGIDDFVFVEGNEGAVNL